MPIFQPSMMKSSSSSRAQGGGDAGSLTPRCSATPIWCMRWLSWIYMVVIRPVPPLLSLLPSSPTHTLPSPTHPPGVSHDSPRAECPKSGYCVRKLRETQNEPRQQLSGRHLTITKTHRPKQSLKTTQGSMQTCSHHLVMPVQVTHDNPLLAVAVHPEWEKAPR